MSFKGKEHNPKSFLKYSNITTERTTECHQALLHTLCHSGLINLWSRHYCFHSAGEKMTEGELMGRERINPVPWDAKAPHPRNIVHSLPGANHWTKHPFGNVATSGSWRTCFVLSPFLLLTFPGQRMMGTNEPKWATYYMTARGRETIILRSHFMMTTL